MSDHHDGGAGDLPAWEEDAPPRRRVRLAVVASLAAVPWIVVAATVLRPPPGPPPLASGSVPAATPDATSHGAAGAEERADGGAPVVLGTVLDGGARGAPTIDEVGAVAVVVGRAFAGGDGAPLDAGVDPSPGTGYVEHLAVEAVDAPSPDLAVVTLLVVVLHAEDGTYRRAELRRLAVPLAVGADGARPAGTPWWLPAPALDPAPPAELAPVDDPDLHLAVAEAVEAAGYRDVVVTAVARTGSWALVVEAEAAAPGAVVATTHTLWLRQHLGGLLVAGTRPADPGPAPPPGAAGPSPPMSIPSPEPETAP